MQVFISWSGERSRAVAHALHAWLPDVLQAVEPWTSSSDISAGTNWHREIEFQLRETKVGILCLTPENLQAPWIMLETGAMWARGNVVTPYLLGFEPSALSGPLAHFQAVTATTEGTWQLVQSLNRTLGKDALTSQRLLRGFKRLWPELQKKLKQLLEEGTTEEPAKPETEKTDRELIEEILKHIAAPSKSGEGNASSEQFVFVVHGHDHGMMQTVARFIEKLGLRTVVLHEQPNQGKTIIEKFEKYSDASYAVVLLTGDDRGGAKADEDLKPRARQNVILELGFFLAQLGRSRVCVLHEFNVEIPSDYSGVLYIPIDSSGAWQFQLGRELRTAGFDVDLNKAV